MSEIRIDRNEWHARVYQWWYQRKYGHSPSSYSNLCPYMRAVLLWSWMRWLFIQGRIGRLRVPIVVWLFIAVEAPRWSGIISYRLKIVFFILYALAATMIAFLATIKAYSEAAHSRICPEVTLVNTDGSHD